jgi:ketosteroid isomerase-like protein
MTGSSQPGAASRPPDELIVHFYDALDRHDGDAMAACYTDDARFEDPAFGELRGADVGRMWRMLTGRTDDLSVELVEHEAGGDFGRAHWVARYTFSTGRKVVNDVQAHFRFEHGLIAEHDDRFDLRRWAAQALGPAGRVLGFTPLLKPAIRRRTAKQLAEFER